jgi:drug/metabolite transporter (DMT)-like permease
MNSSQPTDGLAKGYIALLILYGLWGSTYLGIKFALISFPPFLLGGTRFPLAGLLMLAFVKLRGAPNPTPRQWLHSALYGFLLIGLGNGLIAVAEQYLSSGLVAALLAVSPAVIVLLSGFFGKWPNKLEWMGIGVGLVGVLVMNFDSELRGNLDGLVILIASLLCWCFATVLARYKLDLPGSMTTPIELFSGGALQLIFSLSLQEQMKPMQTPALLGWFYLVLASIVGFTCYNIVFKRLRPALASRFAYVNPVVALLLGATLGGETVSLYAMLGVGVVIAGVLFISLAQQQK